MLKNNKLDNWKKAQNAEKDYWQNISKYTIRNKWKRKQLNRLITTLSTIYKNNSKIEGIVLDLGCGPTIMTRILTNKEIYLIGLDPLIKEYNNIFNIKKPQNLDLIIGVGENLPFKKNIFNIIFSLNVLDHCSEPVLVCKEIKSCLKFEGLLALDLTIYTELAMKFFRLERIFLKQYTPEPGVKYHPHLFTKAKILSILKNLGLLILSAESISTVKNNLSFKVLNDIPNNFNIISMKKQVSEQAFGSSSTLMQVVFQKIIFFNIKIIKIINNLFSNENIIEEFIFLSKKIE